MGKFVIIETEAGLHFNLKAANGEVVARSEVYTTKSACLDGIESVRHNASAPIEDLTKGDTPLAHPKYEVYLDRRNEYRFRLKARNGEIIAASEGYTTHANCLNGIDSIRRNAPDAPITEVKA